LINYPISLSSPRPTSPPHSFPTRRSSDLSGTPSHWRRALMSPQARAIAPRYIRLSGEIADQASLDTLGSFYPQASIEARLVRDLDRKSTRLNSSHRTTSYAVFCLKKKNTN